MPRGEHRRVEHRDAFLEAGADVREGLAVGVVHVQRDGGHRDAAGPQAAEHRLHTGRRRRASPFDLS